MADPDPENAPECVEGPEAFDRFEALTRSLVSVPKSEVEAADAREKARKG
jgi:hypothetical protein